jgi:hypothetical protein
MADAPKVFFVHIMRTGGASLAAMLRGIFRPGEVYPDPAVDLDLAKANLEVPYVLGLSRERHDAIRVYTGHFPFFVTELVDPDVDVLTTTIIREPIQRTISYLQLKLRETDYVLSPEDLYDFPGLNDSNMRNFQTRQFAMTAADGADRALHVLDVDDERLAIAKENLAKIDVLGVHEKYDEYLDALTSRFGWQIRRGPRWHVSERVEISDSLRARIAEDNAMDLAFYEHAVRLYDHRKQRAPGPAG